MEIAVFVPCRFQTRLQTGFQSWNRHRGRRRTASGYKDTMDTVGLIMRALGVSSNC